MTVRYNFYRLFKMNLILLLSGILATITPSGVMAVRMTSPSGSKYVLEGSNVTLTCQFDLEGDDMYSLLWWRDGSVLMRYTSHKASYISLSNSSDATKDERAVEDVVVFDPISNITTRPLAWFPIEGIHATLCSRGWGEELCLLEVRPTAGGVYTCEVTTEAPPTFLTANASVTLHVLVPPLGSPHLSSTPGIVCDGEWISAQCDSPPALPAPNISFYINHKPVVDEFMSGVQVSSAKDDRVVVSRSVGFTASESLFLHGHLILECRVSIEELAWRTEADMLLEGYNGYGGSMSTNLPWKCLFVLMVSSLTVKFYQ